MTLDSLEADITALFDYIEKTINAIHNLVGSIMGVLGEECAFCEELHVVEAE